MAYSHNGDPVYFLNNNPFADMVNFLEPPPVIPAAPAQHVNDAGRFRLPEFWPHAPGIWFARAELCFEVGGVQSDRLKFAYVIDSLPYESLCLVDDLVESPPAAQLYQVLKDRLMMAHQLTPVQKAIKLMNAPDIGDRRPLQLLADLLQDCPAGEQNTAFFRGAFLKRLPGEIQVHLVQTDTADLKDLAQRADQLWLTHRRPAALAPVVPPRPDQEQEDAVLAALSGKMAAKFGIGGQPKKKQQQKRSVTFCWLHHKFGKNARRCDNPEECQFKEN
jgi:hypothetical protein